MAVRSRRLFSISTSGAATLYTVPAGRTLILRGWSYRNPTAVAKVLSLLIVPSGGSAVAWQNHAVAATVGAFALQIPQLVLNPGDALTSTVDTGFLELHGWGALLFGAPT